VLAASPMDPVQSATSSGNKLSARSASLSSSRLICSVRSTTVTPSLRPRTDRH
jgi:hypothetical protein